MPIAIRVVKDKVFADWTAALKARDRKRVKEIILNAALEMAGKQRISEAR
jgi:hypothetical protein